MGERLLGVEKRDCDILLRKMPLILVPCVKVVPFDFMAQRRSSQDGLGRLRNDREKENVGSLLPKSHEPRLMTNHSPAAN